MRGIAQPLALGNLSNGQELAWLGIGALALAVYLISCLIWEYGPCSACLTHRGRNRGSNSRRWGRCKRCHGSGERLRWGYRLLQRIGGMK